MNDVSSLCNLLRSEAFRRRPVMYVGDFSFLRFRSFVDGYLVALQIHNIEEQELDKLSQFFESVAVTYNRDSPAGWANIIWAENYGDGPQCYWDFFRLFDEYFGEQKGKEYYYQLLEVYRGVRKQADFVTE